MNYAFTMMKCSSINNRYFNSKLYEKLRNEFRSFHAKKMSFIQSGINNSQYGKVRCVPIDAQDCKKHIGYFPDQIPDGWITTKEWREQRKLKKEKKEKKEKFCLYCNIKIENGEICKKCKMYLRAPHYKIIDDNFDKIKEIFLEFGSITKTLEFFGIDQQTRKGNGYLSRKLKQDGLNILRRRNTCPISIDSDTADL